MTKTATITNENIRNLRNEAAAAGDSDMVRICERALAGSARAARECRKAIEAARAMGD